MSLSWETLRRQLDGGHILTPGSAGYGSAHRGFNARFHHRQPQAVVRCRTPQDVARTLVFAARNGTGLALRSGGHCFAGHSASTGVIIDVSPMTSVRVSGETATVGAGAQLGHIYAVLDGMGRTIPGGTCPSVGIAGLALGGGLGVLGRQYGVTSDWLTGARVVLASGEILDCDEHRHPELLWALRGAGAGNFGAVTSLTLRTIPAPASTCSQHLRWPAAAAADLIAAWQRWAPTAPGHIAASLKITAAGTPGTGASADIYATGFGSPARAPVADAFISQIGTPAAPAAARCGPFPVARRFWAEMGEGATGPVAGHPPLPVHPFLFSRSEFFGNPLPGEAIGALLAAFAAEPEAGISRELDFMPWGGAYGRAVPDASAFAHRDGLFLLKHSAVVAPPVTAARRASAHRWATRSWDSVHPWGTGRVFPNFADPDLHDPAASYYGRNLPELKRIKQHYDPGNTFWHRQSIPLPDKRPSDGAVPGR
jgi:FAD/FMN-containing dehydrogenase